MVAKDPKMHWVVNQFSVMSPALLKVLTEVVKKGSFKSTVLGAAPLSTPAMKTLYIFLTLREAKH